MVKVPKDDRIKNRFNKYAHGKFSKGVFREQFLFEESLIKWNDIKKHMSKEELIVVIASPRICDYKELVEKDEHTQNMWFIREFGDHIKNYKKNDNKKLKK